MDRCFFYDNLTKGCVRIVATKRAVNQEWVCEWKASIKV